MRKVDIGQSYVTSRKTMKIRLISHISVCSMLINKKEHDDVNPTTIINQTERSVKMGASKSKPYTREAARTVLARRQQMVQGEPTQPAAQQQAAQTAASSATVPPVQQAVTAEHSRPVAPVQPQEVAMPISRSGYDNAEALNPDILREVSKWAVVRTEGKVGTPASHYN